jgi:heme oxygenase
MTDFVLPMVTMPIACSSGSHHEAVPLRLSQLLRASTEQVHKSIEIRLALPGSIRSLPDYRACLVGFYQLYRPMELLLLRFPEWTVIGLDHSACSLSARLAADLHALNVSVPDISCAQACALPCLQDFANALGACYVMEGSALGAQFMLPQLQKVLGNQMTGADTFFRGRSTETAAFWKTFRSMLDLYGDLHPGQTASVVSGAIATFEAIGLWMQP